MAQAQQVRSVRGSLTVGLSGGVFQNKCLTEPAMSLLQEAGFSVYVSESIPASFGQIM